MTKSLHGNPCWYELATSKGNLKAAEAFYSVVLGWKVEDAGMEGFDYHLAKAEGDMVAGLMVMPDDMADMSPFWMIYFGVDDTDKFVNDAKASGASVHREPTAIPGTGRFALLSDPQGAAFGVLQPDTSNLSVEEISKASAFAPGKPGHGNWNELMTSDPEAGFAFYAGLFGWNKGDSHAMGNAGNYQIFRHGDANIGGMMDLGDSPQPSWLPYFGVTGSVTKAVDAIKSAGGQLHHGPAEVPGGSYIAVARDPHGAWFAVTGADK